MSALVQSYASDIRAAHSDILSARAVASLSRAIGDDANARRWDRIASRAAARKGGAIRRMRSLARAINEGRI